MTTRRDFIIGGGAAVAALALPAPTMGEIQPVLLKPHMLPEKMYYAIFREDGLLLQFVEAGNTDPVFVGPTDRISKVALIDGYVGAKWLTFNGCPLPLTLGEGETLTICGPRQPYEFPNHAVYPWSDT